MGKLADPCLGAYTEIDESLQQYSLDMLVITMLHEDWYLYWQRHTRITEYASAHHSIARSEVF